MVDPRGGFRRQGELVAQHTDMVLRPGVEAGDLDRLVVGQQILRVAICGQQRAGAGLGVIQALLCEGAVKALDALTEDGTIQIGPGRRVLEVQV